MKNKKTPICSLAEDVDAIEVYQGGFLVYKIWRDETGKPIFGGRLTCQPGISESRIFYKGGRTETTYKNHK